MISYPVIEFVVLLTGLCLAVVLVRSGVRERGKALAYLSASVMWTAGNAFQSLNLFTEEVLWSRVLPVLTGWMVVSYSQLVAAFLGEERRLLTVAGYGYVLATALPVIPGISPGYGWVYITAAGNAVFLAIVAWLTLQAYRQSAEPGRRNRLALVLGGLGALILITFLGGVTLAQPNPGHALNLLLVTAAVVMRRPPDLKRTLRHGLVYAGVSIGTALLYLVLLGGLNFMLQTQSATAGLVAVVVMVVLLCCLFNALRLALQRLADRLAYGRTCDYRQTLLRLSRRMSEIPDLDELGRTMLGAVTAATGAGQGYLLFPKDDGYETHLTQRLDVAETLPRLSAGSAVVTRLSVDNKPVLREHLETDPEFAVIPGEERAALEACGIEVLCPVVFAGKLVAILALTSKPRSTYSQEDLDLLMTAAHGAGVAIENARMYARARERANTDELTGLYNHRFFHERLDEEVNRCSRFGDIFSLILLDIDQFKSYNDVYGHIAGDEILAQVAGNLRRSVRTTDICFRYGGDEFAVILPRTCLEEARRVADRVRRLIQARTDWKGRPLTCSLGVAAWPTDAVMRGEIVRAADFALYHAKQSGRNRLCIASEIALSDIPKAEAGGSLESRGVMLNTIYALAATVDAKDHYTYGHSKKVSQYATEIAEAMGYQPDAIETLRAAALLHDIGKIGVSDSLLTKREPLTSDEQEAIVAHPDLGVAILRHAGSLNRCLAGVRYHHEHFDGSGYPAGLKGANIPLDARILAVADAYDAMTSQRPYRGVRMSHEQAVAELRRCAGAQFDAGVVEAFISLDRRPIEGEEPMAALAEGAV